MSLLVSLLKRCTFQVFRRKPSLRGVMSIKYKPALCRGFILPVKLGTRSGQYPYPIRYAPSKVKTNEKTDGYFWDEGMRHDERELFKVKPFESTATSATILRQIEEIRHQTYLNSEDLFKKHIVPNSSKLDVAKITKKNITQLTRYDISTLTKKDMQQFVDIEIDFLTMEDIARLTKEDITLLAQKDIHQLTKEDINLYRRSKPIHKPMPDISKLTPQPWVPLPKKRTPLPMHFLPQTVLNRISFVRREEDYDNDYPEPDQITIKARHRLIKNCIVEIIKQVRAVGM